MKEKYLQDLKEIKDIMNKSTRFISLSGLSGISAGIIALIAAAYAHLYIFKDSGFLVYQKVDLGGDILLKLYLSASLTLVSAVAISILFTYKNLKDTRDFKWDKKSKMLVSSLLFPLFAGGILIAMLLKQGFIGFTPSISLIFYGLALVNTSKYTLDEIRSLGVIQVLLGLLAFQFIEYSIIIWALGFGVSQIIYGILIQRKYK